MRKQITACFINITITTCSFFLIFIFYIHHICMAFIGRNLQCADNIFFFYTLKNRKAESWFLDMLLTFCRSPVRWANSTISLPNWLKIWTNSWKVLTLSRWSRVTRTCEEWKDHGNMVNGLNLFLIIHYVYIPGVTRQENQEYIFF